MTPSIKTVLAIDPGSSKLGVALVSRVADKLEIVWRSVVPVGDLEATLGLLSEERPYSMIIIGNATQSRPIVSRVRDHTPSVGILVVDERDTSQHARERYWEHHPRRGWRRLLPASLQVPPVPVDDFVAVILAERVLLS